jgi:hypothetical protein
MIQDLDIYRTAKLIIDKYGEDALIEAALRQDELLAKGDREGARSWSRIGDAIEWMQAQHEITGEIQH